MQVHVLASGSTGNTIVLDFAGTRLLVDAGISTRLFRDSQAWTRWKRRSSASFRSRNVRPRVRASQNQAWLAAAVATMAVTMTPRMSK